MIRKKLHLINISILLVFTLVCGFTHPYNEKKPALANSSALGSLNYDTTNQRFTEKILATVPKTYETVSSAKILSDGRTFGYLARKSTRYAVIYNGREVTELDPDRQKSPGLLKNPGGGILFFGKRNGKCVIVLNDMVRETPSMDSITNYAVSQNGKHFAYITKDKNKQVYLLNVDGKEYGPYDGIGKIAIGNDGNFGLAVRKGKFPRGTEMLISDGGTETPYKSIKGPIFTPDGKTMIYLASSESEKKILLFVGGKLIREYDDYSLTFGSNPAISTDGQCIAFVAKRKAGKDQECIVVDDHYGELFDQIHQIPYFLEGTHEVVYIAKIKNVEYTVIGERKIPGEYSYISANGKTVAKFSNDDKYETTFNEGKATVSMKGHININGTERTTNGMITDMALNQDGESIACVIEYWAEDPGEEHPHASGYAVIHGDTTGEKFLTTDKGPVTNSFGANLAPVISCLTLSLDGKSLAYIVNLERCGEKGKWIIVLNGKKSEIYDGILSKLYFNKDGSKLAFGALKGRDILWKVIQD